MTVGVGVWEGGGYGGLNQSETITNEHDKEIPKERYISPEKETRNDDDLRLK